MKTLFKHRWLSATGITLAAAVLLLLIGGQLDLYILGLVFVLAAVACSYPAFVERSWQAKTLPPEAMHISADRIRKGKDFDLYSLFEIPAVYERIKNRFALKTGDSGSPGLFLYFYLPSWLYDIRNVAPDVIYRRLAARLKEDLQDPEDLDMIAQRSLPLALGFRFLPRVDFPYQDLSRWISIVLTPYFRENTWVRGVLQSPRRQFRIHAPDDNEWRTFLPYLDDTRVLAGGESPAHDFRSNGTRRATLQQAERIGAERVDYPERIPFGALLTYAKKGEITLQNYPEATDKLYIDRINVLVNGSEHRREILHQLKRALNRDLTEEDFYPLFNYGQKLRGYLPAGKAASDFVSSRGNFALYYDADRGWTLLRLSQGLVLRLQETYWGQPPAEVAAVRPLTASRATLITGAPDSLLQFQVSTGTPTRGRIFAADSMIEQKLRDFAAAHGFRLIQSVGSGSEGCMFLAEKDGGRYYLKNPDGQLAQEEIRTVEKLKSRDLIPESVAAYPEDRILVSPEFAALPRNGASQATAASLVFGYVRKIFETGYICLDLTPEHIRVEPEKKRVFMIDFSGYAEIDSFLKQAKELAADRKKIEYRTPEEFLQKFSDAERFEIYLLGLLLFQILSPDFNLPSALELLPQGSGPYTNRLKKDLEGQPNAEALQRMLAYETASRPNFAEIAESWALPSGATDSFWQKVQS